MPIYHHLKCCACGAVRSASQARCPSHPDAKAVACYPDGQTSEQKAMSADYEDSACNPEKLTGLQMRDQAFAIRADKLIYARTILFKLLREADRRVMGLEVKDPIKPNTICTALMELGGKP